ASRNSHRSRGNLAFMFALIEGLGFGHHVQSFDEWPQAGSASVGICCRETTFRATWFCIAVRKREKALERGTAPEIRATGAVSQSPSTKHLNDCASFVEPLNSPPECFLREGTLDGTMRHPSSQKAKAGDGERGRWPRALAEVHGPGDARSVH